MRKIFVLSLLVALAAGVAQANYCSRDNVPAAALLYPYGQVGVVDAGGYPVNPAGKTTIISVTNVSDEAQIVHYTLWNMFSQHVVDWDVILTGYDVIQFNMRDILNGRFDLIAPPPAWSTDPTYGTKFTSRLQQPLQDYSPIELGPDGRGIDEAAGTLVYPEDRNVFSGFANCAKFPYGDYSAGFACFRDKVMWPLEYVQSYPVTQTLESTGPTTNNWLVDTNITLDNMYFYVTAEVVRDCSLLFPSQAEYWTAPQFPTYENVIIGDAVFVDAANSFSEAMPAVAIEADADGTALWNYYDRYAANAAAQSAFEPLPTAFAFRYNNISSTTDLSVTSNLYFFKTRTDFVGTRSNLAVSCPTDEGWLRWTNIDSENGYVYYAWDMDELPVAAEEVGGCPISPCPAPPGQINVLPFEVQNVPLTAENFNLPEQAGWMLIALPATYGTYAPAAEARGNPATDENNDNLTGAMGWAAVQFQITPPGGGVGYSAMIEAAILGNRHCFVDDTLPGLNPYDGAILDGALQGNLGVAAF